MHKYLKLKIVPLKIR